MICIPITDVTSQEALRSVDRAARAADAIELRMDQIADGDLKLLIAQARRASGRTKIIVTCRRPEEALPSAPPYSIRRVKNIPRAEKVRLLKQAIELGADFVDIELAEGDKIIGCLKRHCKKTKSRARLVVSWHDMHKTPSFKELKEIFDACAATGADIVKIVPYATRLDDNIKVLKLIGYAAARQKKIITMCMGDLGQASRLVAPLWGSYLAFGVLPGGKKSAPGQLSVKAMKELRQLFSGEAPFPQSWLLPPGPMNFILVGNPVRQSLSPLMHNRALEAMKIEGHYSAFCVTDPAAAVAAIRGMNIRGASVTIPFKTSVMEYLDVIDTDAAAVGAINTIVNERGLLAGYNTDWWGLTQALKKKTKIAGKTFVVIGAGGTARAAVYGIKKEGGLPVVVNRSVERGKELASAFECPFYPLESLPEIKAEVLVNTTPVGMYPGLEKSPVKRELLANYRVVMDVIYNPFYTKLLRDATAMGADIVSGAEMFIHQGALQLKLWTGREAPMELMRKTVYERLASSEKRNKSKK